MSAPDFLPAFVPPVSIDARDTALLVIDMQYASGSRDHGLGRRLRETGREAEGSYRFDRIEQVVVPGIQRLLAAVRAASAQVVYVTVGSELPDYRDLPPHMRGLAEWVGNTLGRHEHEILAELAPAAGEPVVNKTTTGAFNSSSLDALLRTIGTHTLVVTGISTNSCVETTARDAADRGYRTVLVDDACGATRPEFHDATLRSFSRLFGRVATTAEVVAEIADAERDR